MRFFLKGLAGAIVAMVAGLFLLAQFADYRARAETSRWLERIKPIQDAIAREAVERESLAAAAKSVQAGRFNSQPHFDVVEILDSGVLLVAAAGRPRSSY